MFDAEVQKSWQTSKQGEGSRYIAGQYQSAVMLTGQLCPHFHYSPICFSMVHLFTLNGSQTSNCQKVDEMPEEYGKLSNCQLQNYHWICMECMFFAAERRCDEMKHQPIVTSRKWKDKTEKCLHNCDHWSLVTGH